MVGLVLVLEGVAVHVPKGYVYFAMAFSISVEFLNMRLRKKVPGGTVELREPQLPE
jgi:predicted tellurium resistance membrane protein TerC